jgi:hypothetical protein
MAEKPDTKDAAAAAKGPEKPRIVPELRLDRMSLVEHKHRDWFVYIPHGTQPEDLEAAHYWAHLSHLLRKHDRIECVWEDGTGEVTVRVLAAGQGWAKVTTIHGKQYPKFSTEALNTILPGHRVKYTNDFQRWVVLRDADQRVLKDQCDTEEEAYRWLANYAKSLRA